MPKNPKQKQKLLYIVKYLLENTDENNGVTLSEILDFLDRNGITAERKSIYDDLKTLEDFGYDICRTKSKTTKYYIGSREFELAELKLLVDSVQSSKFITERKSNRLIKKIEQLASEGDAKKLHRQVIVSNRVKMSNEKIYYNVDSIYEAINSKKKIGFYYYEWVIDENSPKKIKKVRRHDGKRYIVSPKALTWDDENYYLIAFDNDADMIKHYRVDKMESIEVLDERAKYKKGIDDLDIAAYSRAVFGMFGGELTDVKLKFDNSMVGAVVDRFSDKVFISPNKDGTFTVSTKVMLSPQFFGWLFCFKDKVKIMSPKKAKVEFESYLDSVNSIYKED